MNEARSCWLVVGLLAGVLVGLCPAIAEAYPQYIGRGELNCSDCHYSPTGGGLLNSWGRVSREVSFDFGDPETFPGHGPAEGKDSAGQPALGWDVGADARLLPLVAGGAGPTSAVLVPMLLEVGGVAAYGRFLAYATVTPRKGPPSSPVEAFSREHWLGYAFTPELMLRAGRLVLPFGIRSPDHTQYVREDFGFDKWNQDYAVELDWVRDDVTVAAAAFAGDLTSVPAQLRASGGVARVGYAVLPSLEVGLSALGSRAPAKDRFAAGAFARISPFASSYLLAEYDRQRVTLRHLAEKRTTQAAYLRAGYYATPALDVYVEGGWRRLSSSRDLDKLRGAVGANWQVAQWFELIPQLLAERIPDVGTQYAGMVQLHLMY